MSRRENAQPGAERRGSKSLARELRKAVVWSEVLGKPLSRRDRRFPR